MNFKKGAEANITQHEKGTFNKYLSTGKKKKRKHGKI